METITYCIKTSAAGIITFFILKESDSCCYWREFVALEWEEYFSDDILKRGKEYFEKEKVKRFEVDDKEKSCQAKVLGTHIYNVKIKKSKYGYDFECDCENSKNFHCW